MRSHCGGSDVLGCGKERHGSGFMTRAESRRSQGRPALSSSQLHREPTTGVYRDERTLESPPTPPLAAQQNQSVEVLGPGRLFIRTD